MSGTYLKHAVVAALAIAVASSAGQAEKAAETKAETHSAKTKEMPKKPIDKVTCAEFNGLDDSFKPKVIAWAAGYQQGKKTPDVVMIELDGIEKVTPFVIDACKKEPTTSFWTKVDNELKKIF